MVALLIAGFVALRGCDDPDSLAVRFDNDLGVRVVLALCHSDHSAKCAEPHYRDGIAPGRSQLEGISTDLRTEWAVERVDGRLLRCVALYWKDYPGGTQVVRLSDAPRWAWPCPRSTPSRAAH